MRSIMFQSINPNGPFLSTITTADKCSLKSSFGTPTTTTGTGGTQQTTSGGNAITVWQDPLVLDLNGDGVRTSGASSPVRFDMQGDGQKELLTWTNPNTEEGFLWIDRNHDGVVTDGTELFGVGTDLPAGVKARDGFEALAMYDNPAYGGNGDGVISKDDDIWNRLRLWVDRNHDGYSSRDEHESIHAYHVEAIRLGYTYALADDESANVHRLHGTYLTKVVGDGPAHLENATVDSLLFRVLAP
jgi:hypothetical protein